MSNSVARVYRPSRQTKISRPLLLWRVPAGFPSPAEDYVEGRIDLNRDLIRHPLATFYIRACGDSMSPAITEGALLVVDRMVETKDSDIIVARLGDDLCIKRLRIEEDGSLWLFSDNENYPALEIREALDFEVWGRVMYSIQSF